MASITNIKNVDFSWTRKGWTDSWSWDQTDPSWTIRRAPGAFSGFGLIHRTWPVDASTAPWVPESLDHRRSGHRNTKHGMILDAQVQSEALLISSLWPEHVESQLPIKKWVRRFIHSGHLHFQSRILVEPWPPGEVSTKKMHFVSKFPASDSNWPQN